MFKIILPKTGVVFIALTLGFVSFSGSAAIADNHREVVLKAVAAPDRPEADRKRDTQRKPSEVLTFSEVAPGMTVIDINSGGGYYTEILSRIVGSEGKVYAHNGPVYWTFMKETIPERFASDRLANVVHLHDGTEHFDVPASSVDLALVVLAYHDYFFTQEARPGGGHEDVSAVLASLKKALKPGGSIVIVDHIAPSGSGPADFDKLHRIDPTFVRSQMEGAGFRFSGDSDILLNPNDDLSRNPFGADIRGRTSRFIYRFVKEPV